MLLSTDSFCIWSSLLVYVDSEQRMIDNRGICHKQVIRDISFWHPAHLYFVSSPFFVFTSSFLVIYEQSGLI